MKIEPFRQADIDFFLKLAVEEGWVAESWEFEFLLSQFPQGCFAARRVDGSAAGFVTSLRHDKSGWIGNLIVSPELRGRKIGEKLFVSALEALWAAGVETVWLTASKAGQPLYRKFGFSNIDTIIRWNGSGRQRQAGSAAETDNDNLDPEVGAIDVRGWGDQRAALLAVTTSRGKLLQHENGFVAVQPCGTARQIGPFAAPDYDSADALLKAALSRVALGTKVCLDVPASNRSALRLFNRKGMRISGSNELMYAGVRPAYQPEYVYGLATMGSCG